MTQRFNGLSFSFDLGDFAVDAKKFTLDITDNSTAAKRKGRPDGFLVGDVEASGTITVDRIGLKAFINAASKAGSFQDIPVFDINSFGKAGDDKIEIEVFGCKAKLSKILDVDTSSSDETEFEIPFDVTSPDFIKIDKIPYGRVITEK